MRIIFSPQAYIIVSRVYPQLFNFDLEVRPLLEVLVGKTVEQALLEVMEEEELASLRAQQVGSTRREEGRGRGNEREGGRVLMARCKDAKCTYIQTHTL